MMEKSSSDSESSPEFEFWNMVDNPPSFPHPTDLLTADQLFAGGILLPLHPFANNSNIAEPFAEPVGDSSPIPPPPSLPAKWKSFFKTNNDNNKKNNKKSTTCKDGKERKKASASANSVGSAAELNIHIWPFSRSHSAGNPRPKAAAVPLRKSSSASGSRNVSGGIHVGRTVPVWRLRRRNNGNAGRDKEGGGGEGISVDVQQSCRGDGGNGRMFNNLRTIFSTKKVY